MTTPTHESAGAGLVSTYELDLDDLTLARFARLVVERELEHIAANNWASEKMTLEGLFAYALSTLRDRTERAALLDLGAVLGEDCLAHVSLQRGTAYVRIAARSVDTLATAKAWIRERYPEADSVEEQRIRVTFWSMSPRCAKRTTRRIEVPDWAEIADNYPASVREMLRGLIGEDFQPGQGGRLVLWHGEPGTGKTYALRALGWEWRSWCDLHYITDPETFFGLSPGYMLDVLLDDEDEDHEEKRWRLLILEDTGELLAADAKQQTGQGLSRLLNVVDGLIGQGLKVLVLVTTNETLRSLHPAVSRPGRCAAQIEFVPFPADEAAAWLDRRGGESIRRSGTLATLYARSAGREVEERPQVGFVR